MLLDLNTMPITTIAHMQGGEGEVRAAMFVDDKNRVFRGTLAPGSSIGLHTHETSSEILYLLSGEAVMVCDGEEERLTPGMVHYCPKGHSHTLLNRSDGDVTFFAVVPQQ